jgi:hypothetical protein
MNYRYTPKTLVCLWLVSLWGCDNPSTPPPGDSPKSSDDVVTPDGGADESDADWETDLAVLDTVFADAVDDDAQSLFGPDKITEIRLTLAPDVWEQLLIDAQDEVYTSADLAIDGEDLGEVGLRFKGSYGSLYSCFVDDELVCSKLPMKIKFNEYDDTKRYKGLKRINLHAAERADQRFLSEYFSYKLFREMGIPTARSGFANVWVNDALLGVFSLVEQIDGRFADSRFVEGNGNLYKEVQLDSTDTELDEALRTNEEAPDHSAFKKFSKEMMGADDDALSATLAKWMNMTYLMRYMAVDDTIFNWDGITAFYCGEGWGCINHNFYLYQEETTARFWLIPWDMDATFSPYNWLGLSPWNDLSVNCDEQFSRETTDALVRPACGDPLLKAIAVHQAATDQYKQALQMLLDEVFDLDAFFDEVDLIGETLAPAVEADPDRSGSGWKNAVRNFKNEMNVAYFTLEDRLDLLTQSE